MTSRRPGGASRKKPGPAARGHTTVDRATEETNEQGKFVTFGFEVVPATPVQAETFEQPNPAACKPTLDTVLELLVQAADDCLEIDVANSIAVRLVLPLEYLITAATSRDVAELKKIGTQAANYLDLVLEEESKVIVDMRIKNARRRGEEPKGEFFEHAHATLITRKHEVSYLCRLVGRAIEFADQLITRHDMFPVNLSLSAEELAKWKESFEGSEAWRRLFADYAERFLSNGIVRCRNLKARMANQERKKLQGDSSRSECSRDEVVNRISRAAVNINRETLNSHIGAKEVLQVYLNAIGMDRVDNYLRP